MYLGLVISVNNLFSWVRVAATELEYVIGRGIVRHGKVVPFHSRRDQLRKGACL